MLLYVNSDTLVSSIHMDNAVGSTWEIHEIEVSDHEFKKMTECTLTEYRIRIQDLILR